MLVTNSLMSRSRTPWHYWSDS